MHEWEFLMQKEGDQDWLSLEAPTAEILEGRYRLMAQSQFTETTIDIQICHICEENGLPKRLMQRRSHPSNPNGLVGVIPYTHLQPGLWKFSCRANTSSLTEDTQDNGLDILPGTVQLLVHAHSAILESDWETPEPPTLEIVPLSESLAPEMPVESPSPEPIVANLPDPLDHLPEGSDVPPQEVPEQITAETSADTETSADIVTSSLPAEIAPLPVFDDEDLVINVLIPHSESSSSVFADSTLEDMIELEDIIEEDITEIDGQSPGEPAEMISTDPAIAALPDAILFEPLDFEPTLPTVSSLPTVTTSDALSEPVNEPVLDEVYSPPTSAPEEHTDIVTEITTETTIELADVALPTAPHPALLSLDQQAFTTSPGQSLALTGQVTVACDLVIQLRDPWNHQLIWQEHLPLRAQATTVPVHFSCEITPPTTDMGILVGEVKMVAAGTDESGLDVDYGHEDVLRQVQTFMITIVESPTPLASAPSDPTLSRTTTAVSIAAEVEEAPYSPLPKRVKIVHLPVFDPELPPLVLETVQGPTLPPQLFESDQVTYHPTTHKLLDLPEFPRLVSFEEAEQTEPIAILDTADIATAFQVNFQAEVDDSSEWTSELTTADSNKQPIQVQERQEQVPTQSAAQADVDPNHHFPAEVFHMRRRFLGILHSLAQEPETTKAAFQVWLDQQIKAGELQVQDPNPPKSQPQAPQAKVTTSEEKSLVAAAVATPAPAAVEDRLDLNQSELNLPDFLQ
jgi:hypothetical protein